MYFLLAQTIFFTKLQLSGAPGVMFEEHISEVGLYVVQLVKNRYFPQTFTKSLSCYFWLSKKYNFFYIILSHNLKHDITALRKFLTRKLLLIYVVSMS